MTETTNATAPHAAKPAAPQPTRRKPPPLRAPKKKFPYRTLKEMLHAWRWGLVRLGIVLVVLILAIGKAHPFAEGLVDEQLASGAVAKGRVLMRGAQQIAAAKMTEFMPADEAEAYLTVVSSLDEVAAAAKFEVEPVEILLVSLDKNGLIEAFGCIVDYESRRYRIEYDLNRNIATPTMLENLSKPDRAK